MAPSKRKTRDDFIVLAPTGKSKIYNIAAKRVGSEDNYAVVATCTSDSMCTRIVTGLALLQQEVVKLEAPAERLIADVRKSLTEERALTNKLRDDVRTAKNATQAAERKQHDAERALGECNVKLANVLRERDEARKQSA